jgi:hypothetical protein
LLVVGLVGLALAIDLRCGAVRRLAVAEEEFVASFGREALARVRATREHPPELAQRLTAAAAADTLSAVEGERLLRLATSKAPPGALAQWRDRCERLLSSLDRARHRSDLVMTGAPGAPPGRGTWRSSQAWRAIRSVRACGLAAAAQGERAAAVVAVELLGAFARSLEAWPDRLSLLMGVAAEKGQLDLVERLPAGTSVPERSRLLAALSGEDLRRRHRDALAGEVIYATSDWHTGRHPDQRSLESWFFGPFEAGAYVRALTWYARGDGRPPSWPDSAFSDARSQPSMLEKEQERLADLKARRDAAHRKLPDTASGP